MEKEQKVVVRSPHIEARRLVISTLMLALMGGCGQLRPSGTALSIALENLSCESCGAKIGATLNALDGVHDAMFRKDSVKVTLRYDPAKTQPDTLVESIEEMGFEASLSPERGSWVPREVFDPAHDVEVISHGGEDVAIDAHRVHGKFTVVDFTAAWCGPCRVVACAMQDILKTRDDVALRIVDIGDWDTPVAQRYLKKVPSLPYIVIYAPSGELITRISGLDIDALNHALNKEKNDADP